MQQEADPSARSDQPPYSTFTINGFGIRVPPFWLVKPAVWFAQLKGQFALSNITQDAAQFYYVISQLDNKFSGGGGVSHNQTPIHRPLWQKEGRTAWFQII